MEYIARQPIFDVHRHVSAYELLFRDSEENRYTAQNQDLASKMTMATAMLVGIDQLSSGRQIYLNSTRELILGGYPTLFPPASTVVEILENVEPDDDLVLACRHLKDAGYRIALDDFEDRPNYAPLIELADIIKVDFRLTPPAGRIALVKRYSKNGRQMLAEKVETDEEFTSGTQMGYVLFQGYFFCRPKILSTHKPQGLNPQHVRLLRILGSPELDFKAIEELIKSDPALCYRLLRYLNSAAFGFRGTIRSILQSVTLLGEVELRKWLLLVFTVMAGDSSKRELVSAALIRARFAELINTRGRNAGSMSFILGLLSLMDGILDLPLSAIAEQLALPEEVRSALLGQPGELRNCLDMILAYEAADWGTCDALSCQCGVHVASLAEKYLAAVKWTQALASE